MPTTNLNTTLATALSLGLMAALAAPAGAMPFDTPKAEASKKHPAVETYIDSFKTAVKGQTKSEPIANALGALAKAGHYKAARYLAKYVFHKSDTVSEAAIKALGVLGAQLEMKYKPHCTKPLLPVLRLDQRNPFRANLAIRSLQQIGDARVALALVKLTGSKNLEVAKAAVLSLKTLKHTAVIDPLIKELTKLEWAPKGRGGNGSSGGTPVGWGRGGLGSKLQQRIQMLKQPVIETLAAITGTNLTTSLSYRSWWKDHKRSFRIAPPKTAKSKPAAKQ